MLNIQIQSALSKAIELVIGTSLGNSIGYSIQIQSVNFLGYFAAIAKNFLMTYDGQVLNIIFLSQRYTETL